MLALKWFYQEGQTENPMSYTELAEHCGVSSQYIGQVARKLVEFGILEVVGQKRNLRYKWISPVTPNESLALRLGRTKLNITKLTDFEDSKLINELRNRGYVIFKEV